jgi:hypothetical protein
MTAQMTEWYPPEIKPVRVGWYKTWYSTVKKNAWWDGNAWCQGDAAQPSWRQDRCWRGLAADPVTKGNTHE